MVITLASWQSHCSRFFPVKRTRYVHTAHTHPHVGLEKLRRAPSSSRNLQHAHPPTYPYYHPSTCLPTTLIPTHSCTVDDLVKVDKTLSPRTPVTIFLPTAGESLHVLRQVNY